MSIQVQRSVDDPIVTFTFDGLFDPESIHEAQTQTVQLLAEMGTFYPVIDIQGSETNFGEKP